MSQFYLFSIYPGLEPAKVTQNILEFILFICYMYNYCYLSVVFLSLMAWHVLVSCAVCTHLLLIENNKKQYVL